MTRQQKTVSRILELKELTTEQREAEVRKTAERLAAEEGKLTALEQEYQRSSDDFAAKQATGSLPVARLELFYTYLKHLGKQIDLQKKEIALRTAEHEQARLAMLEAYKEQRVLEKLQDKLEGERRKVADKSEQKEADFQYLTRNDKA